MLTIAENIATTFQSIIINYSIPPNALISSLPENAYNIITLTHPEYIGSLPSKPFPAWTPPQPAPAQPPPHNQRGISYSHRPVQPQRTPSNTVGGYSGGRAQPMQTPVIRAYTSTPGSTPYTPGTPTYGAAGVRGVGRPRKYEIRR
jgi:hypothetical protein